VRLDLLVIHNDHSSVSEWPGAVARQIIVVWAVSILERAGEAKKEIL
jgi:hypothetical protein